MKSGIFITIRKDSSRLPNKAVRTILNQPIMQLVIRRAKIASEFAGIVVCTTERPVDDEVVALAEAEGVSVYRGSLKDKLNRWNGAAKHYGISHIVTFDGDDLFCEPRLLDLGLEQLIARDLDFLEAPKGLICGAFTYAFTASSLDKVCTIKNTDDTEMMWSYFKDTHLFKTGVLEDVPSIYFSDDIRCTLDYPEDLEFFARVFEHFQCKNNDVGLAEIVRFLRSNPSIPKINFFRQEEFLTNQKKKTHLILKDGVV